MKEHLPGGDKPTIEHGPRISRRRLLGGSAIAAAIIASGVKLGERTENHEQPLSPDERFPHLRWAEQSLRRGEEYSLEVKGEAVGPFLGATIEHAALSRYEELGVPDVAISTYKSTTKQPEYVPDTLYFQTEAHVELPDQNAVIHFNPRRDKPKADYAFTSHILIEERTPLPMYDDFKVGRVRSDNVGAFGTLNDTAGSAIEKIGKSHSPNDPSAVDPKKVIQGAINYLHHSLQLTAQPIQERLGDETSVYVTTGIRDDTVTLTYTTLELLEQKAKTAAKKFTAPVPAEKITEASNRFTETADRLIHPEMLEQLGFHEILSPVYLEKARQSGSLSQKRQQTEHGAKQTFSLNLENGDVAERIDFQSSELEKNGVRISSKMELFLNARGVALNTARQRNTVFTEQECVEIIQLLAPSASIREEDIIIKSNGLVTAAPLVDGWRMSYQVHPNGYIVASDSVLET